MNQCASQVNRHNGVEDEMIDLRKHSCGKCPCRSCTHLAHLLLGEYTLLCRLLILRAAITGIVRIGPLLSYSTPLCRREVGLRRSNLRRSAGTGFGERRADFGPR